MHDTALDDLLDARMSWDVQIALIATDFDGDCAKHATRLVAISPLAQALRDGRAALSSDARAKFDERERARVDKVTAKVDHDLGLVGKTRADVDRGNAQITATCEHDAQFQEILRKAAFIAP